MAEFVVTAPLGASDLLGRELTSMGVEEFTERSWGGWWSGSLESAYRACLWSRVASRVLLKLHTAPAASPEALYEAAQQVSWCDHLGPNATLAVDFDTTRSQITHTKYGALKVKDAIVDQIRDRRGSRPNIDTAQPSVRVNVRVVADQATFAIDLSGDSLHRRGWRASGVAAPLKENLAAALLMRAGWPEIAAQGGAFLDPMCGSGTLPIEAALMAADVAPGLRRTYYGFLGWAGHDSVLWARLLEEARARADHNEFAVGRVFGSDQDGRAVEAARESSIRAGVAERVRFERRVLAAVTPPASVGLLLVNPPYGERLGEVDQLRQLYAELGEVLRSRFVGWQAAVFTGNPALCRELKVEARRKHRFFNGPIEAQLLRFDVVPGQFSREFRPGRLPPVDPERRESPGAKMFANRLRKNLDAMGKWARREGVCCYRVYDADMPEYAFAIDVYGADADGVGGRYAFVQEYAAPASIAEEKVRMRRAEVVASLPQTLCLDADAIWFRTRRRQKGSDQYNKVASEGDFHEVSEGGLRFFVNFDDYLDTGLFLDHRLTRAKIREWAQGRRFLNLFAYTGTATVYAAAGGAVSTTTVDMSRTYLDWARRNLALNGLDGRQHVYVQADVLDWVDKAPASGWDLIFLDPPTFSNSKRMTGTFDVQRDHVALLRSVARLLTPGGLLVFSTNYTRFELDQDGLGALAVEDITRATIPRDFERNARIHRCYLIRRSA